MYIIYRHVNTLTNKSYIGLTHKTLEERWHEHCRQSESNRRYYFHKAIAKFGLSVWSHEILAESISTIEEANLIEEKMIELYKSSNSKYGYNLTRGGDGVKANEKLRQKMSKSQKRRTLSAETKAKMSEAQKRRPPITEETREKLRSHGKPHTYEAKQRMRESALGRKMSTEARKKMSEVRTGIKQTRERVERRLEKVRGKKRTNEQKQRMRESALGRKMSTEARKKMSESAKARWKNRRESLSNSSDSSVRL